MAEFEQLHFTHHLCLSLALFRETLFFTEENRALEGAKQVCQSGWYFIHTKMMKCLLVSNFLRQSSGFFKPRLCNLLVEKRIRGFPWDGTIISVL